MPSFPHAAPTRCVKRNIYRKGYLTGTFCRKIDQAGPFLTSIFPKGRPFARAAGRSLVACVTALQIPVAPHLEGRLFVGPTSSGFVNKRWLLPRAAAQTSVRDIDQRTSDQMQALDGSQKTGAPADPPAQPGGGGACDTDALVQYVVVRRDLSTGLNWPLGAVIAQACHAAVCALGLAMKNCPDDAQRYLAEGSAMRTVVLQVSSEEELLKLRDKLTQRQISHELWQEEPEKVPTALASVPITKSAGKAFKGLQLLS